MTRLLSALSEIDGCFDAVLADQFGVLHDGAKAFDGARETLAWLASRGIPVAVLSNSGRTPQANTRRLLKLGFPRSHFREAVTSGGLAKSALSEMLGRGTLQEGDEVLVIASASGADTLNSLPLRYAKEDERARLVVIAGSNPLLHSRADYAARLQPLAKKGIPALCCNPDRVMYADGAAQFGAAIIAEDYESAGGRVSMLGKPGLEMFRAGLRAVGSPQAGRCLVIGDSPAHDVAGAKRAGCLALLITSGVQSGLSAADAEPDFSMHTLRP